MNEFIAFRRSVGFEYRTQIYILQQLDRVASEEMVEVGPVTRDVIEAFLRSLAHQRPLTRRVWLSTVRQFLIFLSQHEPDTYVPDRALLPAAAPRPPYIYTDDEIRALLRAALRYPRRYPRRRWLLHHTLIGFLYVTGMRISEAMALNLADIDVETGIVHIRKTKFHKSRLVPLKDTSIHAIQRYLVQRAERGHPTTPTAPVFVREGGGRLSCHTARGAFSRIRDRAGVHGPPGGPRPRVHDLRHTAAVRRLYLWYREGKDVQALLPVLGTYLGHSAVRCTEVYLTATSELLAEAATRFEAHFPLDLEGDPPP